MRICSFCTAGLRVFLSPVHFLMVLTTGPGPRNKQRKQPCPVASTNQQSSMPSSISKAQTQDRPDRRVSKARNTKLKSPNSVCKGRRSKAPSAKLDQQSSKPSSMLKTSICKEKRKTSSICKVRSANIDAQNLHLQGSISKVRSQVRCSHRRLSSYNRLDGRLLFGCLGKGT